MSNQISLESSVQLTQAQTPSDIGRCFLVLKELRSGLMDRETFLDQMMRQTKDGYMLCYVRENDEVCGCVGYRIFETLAWGKILYIDDLVVREKSRKKGFATKLMDYVKEQARIHNCDQIHLDSGHHRHEAHRFYLKSGFCLNCHHFAYALSSS